MGGVMWGDELLNREILETAEDVMQAAKHLRAPVIVWDTSRGSYKSRFYLADYEGGCGRGPEISRLLFNTMKIERYLDDDPAERRKIGRYQAWPVKVDG